MSNETQVTPGHDRYGYFVIVNGFRSAMPDEATARFFAAAPEMAALLERMLVFCEAVESRTGSSMEEGNLARALLAKIKGATHA